MKPPRPSNTLTEAAKWMTESTGTEWTSDSLLDVIFRKMMASVNLNLSKQTKNRAR